jgi:uncharacterized membrane protein YraQ (UPF0718 family)
MGFAVGPLLVAWGRGRRAPSAAIDGFTLGVVPSLLLLHLVPHVVEEVGAGALALVALGYTVLWMADRRAHDGGERIGAALVLPTLVIHALGDGAGLAIATSAAGHREQVSTGLGLALVLHRLPEGLFLATAMVPVMGWRRAIPRLSMVAGATVVGALLGSALLSKIPDAVFDAVAAFGIGAMLRLATHRHGADAPTPLTRALSAVTFVAGVVIAAWIPDPDSVLRHARPHELSFIESLGPLFVETAPSMLIGLAVAGAVQTWAPRKQASWLNGRGALSQALRGMLFGVPLPLCSCGVLPLVRRLLAARVPVAAVAAFAAGTPALDVGGAVFSFRLFGAPLALARIASGFVIAVAVALAVAWSTRGVSMRFALRPAPPGSMLRPSPPWSATPHEPESDPPEAPRRALSALRQAVGPTLDHVAAWYVAGLCLAAAFEAAVDPAAVAGLGAPLDVVLGALAAVPVYMCAQGAAPFAAVMIHKGASLGAALAFAMVAPGTNLPVLAAFRRSLGNRAALAFGLASLATAVAVGLAANALVPAASVPEMHHLVAHAHAPWELACAGALAGLLLRSMVRVGPRAWFAAMAPNEEPAADRHAH